MTGRGDFEIIDALYASGSALFYVALLGAAVILTVFLVRFLLTATKAAQLYIERHGPEKSRLERDERRP